MLFPLPVQTSAPAGLAKAFDYYLTAECLPQERVGTVYVARKLFPDGSTVTLVKGVPIDRNPTARLAIFGEGWIERDSEGAATRIKIDVKGRGGNWDMTSEFAFDPKRNVLVGMGRVGNAGSKDLELPDRKAYVLDPIEALAFGSNASLGRGWLLPSATYGAVDAKSPIVGLRYGFTPFGSLAVDLAGRREMLTRVDVTRAWIGCSYPTRPESAGTLLLYGDGSLAAYAPSFGVTSLPGTMKWAGTWGKVGARPIAPPPFKLSGRLAQAWEQGATVSASNAFFVATNGLIVPAPISPREITALLDSIPDKAAPDKTDGPGDDSPAYD